MAFFSLLYTYLYDVSSSVGSRMLGLAKTRSRIETNHDLKCQASDAEPGEDQVSYRD
jgi:hypothetical protein